jgi:uncharacterized membrane protein YeaQ/YmgE (transglycosylase-associated protein family)
LDYLIAFIILPWWFSLPGYVANICPGIARSFPGGKVPVSQKYLGPNKTWAAIPAALVGATLTVILQSLITYPAIYPKVSGWIIALCFGIGAPLGDWTKSLMKRFCGIEPGGKWWVEKIDFLIMSFLFITIVYGFLPLQYYLIPIIFYFLVHGPGNKLSYKLGWRNSPH